MRVGRGCRDAKRHAADQPIGRAAVVGRARQLLPVGDRGLAEHVTGIVNDLEQRLALGELGVLAELLAKVLDAEAGQRVLQEAVHAFDASRKIRVCRPDHTLRRQPPAASREERQRDGEHADVPRGEAGADRRSHHASLRMQ